MTDVDDWSEPGTDWEPTEPDEDDELYARHCEEVHGGRPCDCPPQTPEEIEVAWAERARQHRDEDHGGGECDCEAPF